MASGARVWSFGPDLAEFLSLAMTAHYQGYLQS